MENTNTPTPSADQGKTIAIVSYFTLIGWIIALVMHGSNKTSIGAYHIRQSLGLMLLAISTIVIRIPLMFIPFLGWGLNLAISIGLLIFWILGLVTAINGEEKPLPLIGDAFQKWFASIGK
ncbi:MAG: hypothetical protein H0U95_12495 [Bacteroidetes bacterium]|nr:hypothetical protein [Bacteroidota bacterium]